MLREVGHTVSPRVVLTAWFEVTPGRAPAAEGFAEFLSGWMVRWHATRQRQVSRRKRVPAAR